MDLKKNTYSGINKEEIEETLSFCDLSVEYQDLDDQSLAFLDSSNSSSHDHERFQFPLISNIPLDNNKTNGVVFCGKLIEERDFVVDNRDQGKHFFSSPSVKQFNNNKKDLGSLYLVNSKSNSSLPIQSFRSRNSSSVKQYKSLIGITKIQPKMELSDLKKRQSKRDYPLPMFPAVTINMDAADGCGAGGKRCLLWSLLRPSRRGTHALKEKNKTSLGCIPHV